MSRIPVPPIFVRLNEREIALAKIVGEQRIAYVLAKGCKDRLGQPLTREMLQRNVNGSYGELAACRVTGRHWLAGVDGFGPDLFPDLQVRTRPVATWDLGMKPHERECERFVLVTGELPDYALRGWAWGYELKRPENRKSYGNNPPCWYLPQSRLRDIRELIVDYEKAHELRHALPEPQGLAPSVSALEGLRPELSRSRELSVVQEGPAIRELAAAADRRLRWD